MSKINNGMFSSNTDQWATPIEFFNKLNEKFRFTLDPCADERNHKCEKYYTKDVDGLKQDWGGTLCSVILHMAQKLSIG